MTFSILFFLYNWLKPYKLGSISAAAGRRRPRVDGRLAAVSAVQGPAQAREIAGHEAEKRHDLEPASLAAVVAVFFFVPLPISRVRQVGLVQIDPPAIHKVTLTDDAILTALHVENGQQVEAGKLLAEFRSPKLEVMLAEYQRRVRLLSRRDRKPIRSMLRNVQGDEEQRSTLEDRTPGNHRRNAGGQGQGRHRSQRAARPAQGATGRDRARLRQSSSGPRGGKRSARSSSETTRSRFARSATRRS